MLQTIGLVASVISIVGAFIWIGRVIYRQASAPKGYVVILTGVSLLSLLTFVAVVGLFFIR